MAEEGGEVVGFLVARQVVSDIEILNFAVDAGRAAPRSRQATVSRSARVGHGCSKPRTALLEVRASNLAALHFYERHDFRVTAPPTDTYYTAPVEDALLLIAPLR